jgi:hypothetical protein
MCRHAARSGAHRRCDAGAPRILSPAEARRCRPTHRPRSAIIRRPVRLRHDQSIGHARLEMAVVIEVSRNRSAAACRARWSERFMGSAKTRRSPVIPLRPASARSDLAADSLLLNNHKTLPSHLRKTGLSRATCQKHRVLRPSGQALAG